MPCCSPSSCTYIKNQVADFAYRLFSRSERGSVVSARSLNEMLQISQNPKEEVYQGYGLGIMSGYNFMNSSQMTFTYGHAGDTYGFESGVLFFPWLDVSIAVATSSADKV